jgi:hypothetical protein
LTCVNVNVPSKSNKQKNFFNYISFQGVLKVNDEDPDPNPDPLVRHGFADPDPHQMSWIRNTGTGTDTVHLNSTIAGICINKY